MNHWLQEEVASWDLSIPCLVSFLQLEILTGSAFYLGAALAKDCVTLAWSGRCDFGVRLGLVRLRQILGRDERCLGQHQADLDLPEELERSYILY